MKVEINGKECEQILKDYAFNNFGKLLCAETVLDLDIDIDTNYSSLRQMTISKKQSKVQEESEA